jgi:hypothetical protein
VQRGGGDGAHVHADADAMLCHARRRASLHVSVDVLHDGPEALTALLIPRLSSTATRRARRSPQPAARNPQPAKLHSSPRTLSTAAPSPSPPPAFALPAEQVQSPAQPQERTP